MRIQWHKLIYILQIISENLNVIIFPVIQSTLFLETIIKRNDT